MRRFVLCLAFSLAVGCAPQAREPGPMAAAGGLECIDLDQVVSRRPAGPQSLVFELIGGRAYRNDLPDRCPGFERAGNAEIVEVEPTGSQLCRNDRVRIFDPVEARNIGLASFPRCRLGAFTPIGPVNDR